MFGSHRTRRAAHISVLTLLVVGAAGALGAAPAGAALPGSVYAETNAAVNNEVVVFTRAANGTISETSRASTGGNGDNSTPPFGFFIVDTQGAVELSDSEHLLFAVNAGSDTLSSFRVLPGGGLSLVGSVATGDLPVSVDSYGDLVYVVNEGDQFVAGDPRAGTIQGYRASPSGVLTAIPGSEEPLSVTGSDDATPAQIGFDPTGRVLTVVHRAPAPAPAPPPAVPLPNRIDTFVLGADRTPGPAIVNAAPGSVDQTGNNPFGFAYDDFGHLIVSNTFDENNAITSFSLNANGTLSFIEAENTFAGPPIAPCWVVITPDNKYAFVTNTLAGNITRLQIGPGGTLTELLPKTVAPGSSVPPPPTAPTDVVLTPDGKYLTMTVSGLVPGSVSLTNTYEVGADGSLTLLPGGTTPATLPAGTSGLAASSADATAPDTAITSGPPAGSRTNDSTPTFAFSTVPTTEANPTFTCAVDGGAATACTTPFTTAVLGEGVHTIAIGATDFGGNTDTTPASRAFVVDTIAPNTTITSGPGAITPTSDTTPTFAFTSTESDSSFRCRVDSRPVVACTSPFTTVALAAGSHTFSVAATDVAGNADATAATRTFTVKRRQPGCAIAGKQRIGTGANNTLVGGSGVDILFGLGGNDTLSGHGNRDCLYGGSGADKLNGGSRNDRMYGEAGQDRLTDANGKDVFSGGSQGDRIDARDRTRSGRRVADTVRCGSGRDSVLADRVDHVAKDCERVARG